MIAILVLAAFSGCSFTVKNVRWPETGGQPLWYKPAYIYSPEEASSVLKGLIAGASINGRPISTVDVDKFTLRAGQKWQETYENTEYVPSFGGFFIGWNYVPTYSGSYQTNTTTLNKENNISINFRDITDITINGRVLYISAGNMSVIVCASYADAQKFGDAFYSMLKNTGGKLGASYGFSFSDINDDQAKEAGIKGAVAEVVYANGPAEKAGLKPADVIYEAAGRPVASSKDLVEAFRANGTSRTIELKVFHWEKAGNETIKWEKRLVSIRPVER
ncbi:MAG TPA: PDZ domain-containing protein [Candidatus Goldiibacteriota bacterium]|nr:PDZ domain-containing protein [Candidatus Goldiibacteriota bacterium]